MQANVRNALIAILMGGFLAGTIDIGAAALISWLHPVVILYAVASGLLGKAAFHGGALIALTGLGLQWAMSLLIAAIYFFASARLPRLRQRWWLGGLIAGVVIFLVMNYLVLPLSAAPFRPQLTLHDLVQHFHADKFLENLLAMLVFGWIVAFCAQHFAPAEIGERNK